MFFSETNFFHRTVRPSLACNQSFQVPNHLTLALFLNFLPTPLTLLTDSDGIQSVHIAPEAFQVASAEFGNEIEFWQNALPGSLKGQLASVRPSLKRPSISALLNQFSFRGPKFF